MERADAIARKGVSCLLIALIFCMGAAQAQTVRSATGVQQRTYIPAVRQPHSSKAHDTTPFNCEQYELRLRGWEWEMCHPLA
jgi:hypothetical protein